MTLISGFPLTSECYRVFELLRIHLNHVTATLVLQQIPFMVQFPNACLTTGTNVDTVEPCDADVSQSNLQYEFHTLTVNNARSRHLHYIHNSRLPHCFHRFAYITNSNINIYFLLIHCNLLLRQRYCYDLKPLVNSRKPPPAVFDSNRRCPLSTTAVLRSRVKSMHNQPHTFPFCTPATNEITKRTICLEKKSEHEDGKPA